jgi:dihydrofolate reductase
MSIIAIVARDVNTGLIGADGGLPWHLPRDLAFFKNMTGGKTVAMGRATYDSLPVRPLPNRKNMVLSASMAA